MKTKNLSLLLLLFVGFNLITSCKKEGPAGPQGPAGQNGQNGQDGSSDKQIRLVIEPYISTSTTAGMKYMGLIKFDKRNYAGVDSIIFVSNVYSGNVSSHGIVELYNFTDSVVINHSLLQSNQPQSPASYVQTGNIYSDLPEKEVDLGIWVRSETAGIIGGTYLSSHLFLYRK